MHFFFPRRCHTSKVVLYALLASIVILLLWTSSGLPEKEPLPHPKQSIPSHPKASRLKHRHRTNRYIYPFFVNASHVCRPPNISPSLVVFVTSAPSHRRARDAIRSSWAIPSYLEQRNVKVLFLLAHSKFDSDILGEAENHGDIIQGSFVDSYTNLTLKTIMMLYWTKTFCPGVYHIMKTDDDVYVNLDNVLHHLRTAMAYRKRWIQGCVKEHVAQPILTRDGKPVGAADMSRFPRGHPPFLAGAGYLVSGDLVSDLLRASAATTWIPVEDMFLTGLCARRIGLEPETDDRFTCGRRVDEACELQYMFTGHGVSPEFMVQIWEALLTSCVGQRNLELL